MLVPPVPTAAATLATVAAVTNTQLPPVTTAFATRMLELRQDFSSQYGNDLSCIDYIESLSCDSAYVSCLDSVESSFYEKDTATTYAYTQLDSAISGCYCDYGVQYLSCYYGALEQKACASYFGTYDWTSYESYWFYDSCGTVPATLFGGGGAKTTKDAKPPTVVSLDLQSVHVVSISSAPPIPTFTYTPLFQSTGSLLKDECASTQFTLIEDVSTVYWAAYIGCASNQPQCCPWTAASEFFPATVTGNTTVTVTSTLTAGATTATGTNVALNAFPVAANRDQGVLKACASDYYSISGNCCPSNYWPFTRDLGGQTPCYSSLNAVTDAPTLTAGLIGQPTATQKPTSAVVNVVWAMSYPVESSGGLSKGAIAGIVVGVVVVVALLAVLSFFLYRARRKNRLLQQQQNPQQQAVQPPQQPQQYVQPQQEGQQMAAVPLAYDPNKPQGMVQVQPAVAGGYVYPPQQQQQLYPQQQGYPQQQPPGYPPNGGFVDNNNMNNINRASLAPSSVTPVSMLVPQSTGTTNISELSSTAGLVAAAGGSPYPVNSTGGGSPAYAQVYPAPIAEADEASIQQQQQQQYYQVQQHPQQPGQVVYHEAAPSQQPHFVEMADGQQPAAAAAAVASPVEMASAGPTATAAEVVSPLTSVTAHPPGPQDAGPQGHQPT